MIVYHGSNQEIAFPDVLHSKQHVDFGPGFYVTPLREQAVNWARRFQRSGGIGVISAYELEDAVLDHENLLRFDTYSEAWLDFIIAGRRGIVKGNAEIIMGGVADDRVFDTVELFLAGLIDKSAALERLVYQQPNYQICLRTQPIIDQFLHFRGSEIL